MRVRALVVPFLALLPVLFLDGPASAQTCVTSGGTAAQAYPPTTASLALGTTTVSAGGSLTVSGSGFAPNCLVTLEFRSAPVTIGSVQANSSGAFSTTVAIPADATPGDHTVAALGVDPTGRRRELTATVTVLAVETARGGALPRTGAATLVPTGLAGAALVGVGTLALLASRRKRAVT